MYDLFDVVVLFALILAAGYWWKISGQKAVAIRSARQYCSRRGIQLLDQTLVFRRYRLCRDGRGKNRLCRVYGFDFCRDGADRHRGEILLAGFSVIRVLLETEHLEITQF